jgi:PAS domain S-box-containing protein
MQSRLLNSRDKYPYQILVVEDNLGDFVLVEDYLEETMSAAALIRAETFEEATKYIRKKNYDVILLDLTLPDMSLSDLIKSALSLAGNIPVIALTGHQNIDFTIKSIKAGISDYILKDEINAALLYRTIVYSIQRSKFLLDLRESEKRYIDLFRLSPSPKWIFDPETFQILEVNLATCEFYGYSTEELRQMSINDILIAEDQKYFRKITHEKEANPSKNISFRFRKKSGEIAITQTKRSDIIYKGKLAQLLLSVDVTEEINTQKELLSITFQVENQERSRLSSVLHDGIQQDLLAIYKHLESVINHAEKLEPKFQDRFQKSMGMLNESILKVRSLAHELIPPSLENLGFKGAVNEILNKFDDIHFSFYQQTNGYKIPMDTQLFLFRVTQELINNIVKHSNAKEASIELEVKNNTIYLVALDDGVGFDMNEIHSNKAFGITSMQQRVESLKGIFNIHSQKNKGTKVLIRIPIT